MRTVRLFFSRPALWLTALACGATQIVTYGAGNFTTLLLIREKGMTMKEVALYYALVVLVGMGGGIFASGWVIDSFTRFSKQAYAVAPAIALAIAVPPFLGFVWAPSWPLALVFLLGPTFFNYFYLSSAVALVQEEVAPHQRVLSGALLLLVMNLIGMGVGPTFVGALSDALHASHPPPFLANRVLLPSARVRLGHRAVHLPGARASQTRRKSSERSHEPVSSSRSVGPCDRVSGLRLALPCAVRSCRGRSCRYGDGQGRGWAARLQGSSLCGAAGWRGALDAAQGFAEMVRGQGRDAVRTGVHSTAFPDPATSTPTIRRP